MFKIKLSILLLISFFIFSCTNNKVNQFNQKYSLAYIGGEFDGLLLKNYLSKTLNDLDIYDKNSIFEIRANIIHNSGIYITNIDNTSDRERIDTTLFIEVINKKANCTIFRDEIGISQFYIYATSDKFLSNQAAVKKIKKINTETSIKKFINRLKNINNKCHE